MNTARIVVLTIAIGAGGIAACPASGSDKSAAPARPVAQLQTADILVARSDIGPGQSVKAGANMVDLDADEQSRKRRTSVNVVSYDVAGQQTMPK